MNNIYFIAGASGSGKTAIIPDLTKILGESIAVFDFDDIGVPEGADKRWRQESTEKWIQKLLNDNQDTCLIGQIVLGEILACPSAQRLGKINFCFLDVNDFERIKRLKKRNTYGADQNMLNWSSWLRMHHKDPQWMQHVLKDECWSGLDFSAWDQMEQWNSKANIEVLDTTDLTLAEVATDVADWIQYINSEPYQIVKSNKEVPGFIGNQIEAFNNEKVAFTQEKPFVNLNFFIQDASHVIIAGINSLVYCWGMLYVGELFVDEKHRTQGHGSRLLKKVEDEAKALGVTLAHLDTFDFQALDFYLKHGYEVFGTLDACPKGHKRYYLKKFFTV